MSGEKFSTRPVFSRAHTEAVAAHTRLEEAVRELEGLELIDRDRKLVISCGDLIDEFRAELDASLVPVERLQPGTQGRQALEAALAGRKAAMDAARAKVMAARSQMLERREDHATFVAFEEECGESLAAFRRFREGASVRVGEYLDGADEAASGLAKGQIKQVELAVPKPGFAYGFRTLAAEHLETLEERDRACRSAIEAVTGAACRSAIDRELRLLEERGRAGPGAEVAPGAVDGRLGVRLKRSGLPKEVERLVERIRSRLKGFAHDESRQQLEARLEQVLQGRSAKEAYVYRELLEDLDSLATTRSQRLRLKAALVELARSETNGALAQERARVTREAAALFEKARLRESDVDGFTGRVADLRHRHSHLLQEERVAARQSALLRRKLVESLEALGYEVLEDAELIDFERQSEYLLQVPEQPNVVSLRFNPDGSFGYNFLIPEAPATLEPQEKEARVEQMEASCAAFKRAVREVVAMGVELAVVTKKSAGGEALAEMAAEHKEKVRRPRGRRGREAGRLRTKGGNQR